MRTRSFVTVAALALALAVATACGGSHSSGSQNSPVGTEEASAGPSSGSGSQPASTGVSQAVLPDDAHSFLAQFQHVLNAVSCPYDEQSSIVDCSKENMGRIHLDPPVHGKGLACAALLDGDRIIGASCNSQDPLFGAIYKLAGQ